MQTNIYLIQPLIALVLWSMIMWVWLYATRLPAISAMKLKLDPNIPSNSLMAQLPPRIRWKADNYNHLMEQPTIFYALVLSLAFLGESSLINIYAAWAYVVIRIIHSLVQALINKIELRFILFCLSNIALLVLTLSAVVAVL